MNKNQEKVLNILKVMKQNKTNDKVVIDCLKRLFEMNTNESMLYFEKMINENIHNHFKSRCYNEALKGNIIEINHTINNYTATYILYSLKDLKQVVNKYTTCYCSDCNKNESDEV